MDERGKNHPIVKSVLRNASHVDWILTEEQDAIMKKWHDEITAKYLK
jgi:hypothetical protein